jgi:hypothetical protein
MTDSSQETTSRPNGAGQRIMIPVAPEFWEELRGFLEQNSITPMDLKRAGINYNTARKIVLGTQTAHSVNSDYMMIFTDMVNDPEKYKRGVIAGAIASLSEMMSLNLSSH